MKQITVTLASEPCMMIDVVVADSHQNLLSKGLDPIFLCIVSLTCKAKAKVRQHAVCCLTEYPIKICHQCNHKNDLPRASDSQTVVCQHSIYQRISSLVTRSENKMAIHESDQICSVEFVSNISCLDNFLLS